MSPAAEKYGFEVIKITIFTEFQVYYFEVWLASLVYKIKNLVKKSLFRRKTTKTKNEQNSTQFFCLTL